MIPNRQDITPILGFSCLPLLLVFPVTLFVPVLNYMISLAAVFAALYLAINKMDILLTIGLLGSLGVLLSVHGLKPWMVSFWAVAAVPGAVFGRAMALGITPRKAFFAGMTVSVVLSLLFFYSIREPFNESIDAFGSWMLSMVGSLDTSDAFKADLADSFEGLLGMTKRLAPAFMALHGVTLLFVGWLILKMILDMMRKFHPGLGNFIYWKMPQLVIYIAGLFLLTRLTGPDILKVIADNALLFLGFFYALFGFAVIEFFLKKVRLSLILKVLFYLGFVFLQLPGLMMAAMIGLFDSYFDFRKVRARMIG
ncbi:MAG: DUF2232 domain-containing protein [Candidatus Zixiibacteriota bacterium]